VVLEDLLLLLIQNERGMKVSVEVDGKNVFTKTMTRVFNTEVIECPDCVFEFSTLHEQHNEPGIYVCPLCELTNVEAELRELKKELNELRHFKNHAEFLLSERQFEYLEEETKKYLEFEQS